MDEFAHRPANLICFREATRWSKTSLGWRIGDFLAGVAEGDQLAAAEAALALWAEHTPLEFERRDADADITISFVGGSHGDLYPFDGARGILGHAFFPGSGSPGQVHLCEEEAWSVDGAAGSFDLLTVLAHEIGHALGLEHSTDPDAVMYYTYAGTRTSLADSDIAAIQVLYGSADGSVAPLDVPPPGTKPPPSFNLQVDPDTDGDGIPDTVEVFVLNTDYAEADSDDDGDDDFTEVFVTGGDPLSREKFLVTLTIDGIAIAGFDVFDEQTEVRVGPVFEGAEDPYQVAIRGNIVGAAYGVVFAFDSHDDLTGRAIPADQIEGIIAIGPESEPALSCQTQDPTLAESCGQSTAVPGGTIELRLAGGRLTGSFDVTIDDAQGRTFGARGEIDVPERFRRQ
jgi:hypothetical protein